MLRGRLSGHGMKPRAARGPGSGVWQADPMAGFDRPEALTRLAEEQFDVLVVGGGITGAGVALDAASRGLKTALVERNDFASGTSSKSSKMVHGGLRYLQQRDFRLVYEALHERQILLENAPHLVSPLPFLIPLFGRDGVVNKAVSRTYSTALWLYDVTGGWRIGKRHKRIGRDAALSHLPTLRAERLVAAFLYYDARADDARLTLSIARTAAVEYGAVCANYAEVVGFVRDDDGDVAGATVRTRDKVSGDENKEFTVNASVVVNATGVWADEVRALDEGAHPRSLRPAKGVHVTVPRSRLPADVAAVIPVRADKRSIFVVPWPDGDDVYLGTTDTPWDGSLDEPICKPEDVDYLLEAANAITTSDLTREDVTGLWAGLRPLLDPGDRHLSERTQDLSRRHTVRISKEGVVTVTGGKLTTYRRMAEQTVDAAVTVLGRPKVRACRTRHLKIIGAPAGTRSQILRPESLESTRGLSPDLADALLRRHGTETAAVLAMADQRPDLLEPIVEGLPYLKVEVLWAARNEMALTVEDVLARRTRAVLRNANGTARAAGEVARILADELQLSGPEMSRQSNEFAESVSKDLERAGLKSPQSAR
jgi:glycerol-3-phosphate dehydrogenase